jgi:hypothetical protein
MRFLPPLVLLVTGFVLVGFSSVEFSLDAIVSDGLFRTFAIASLSWVLVVVCGFLVSGKK